MSLKTSSYTQDETIPIWIMLNYNKIYTMKFPINPDNLTKEIPSNSQTVDIEGIGQVSVPTTPKLAKLTISSMFWHQNNLVPGDLYVMWLEKWQSSKQPANLVVTRLNYSMKVTCESFRHWINAGEEKDIYFELELQEYRPYGAKRVSQSNNATLRQKLQKIKNLATLPVLMDIPRPNRDKINKESITNPYTTKKGETLSSITKKITGKTDDWESLYSENKETFAEIYAGGTELAENTKLTLPEAWVENTNYNITNVS